MIALIDADILCYEIGFVTETVTFSYKGKHYGTVTDAKANVVGLQTDDLERHVHPDNASLAKKMIDTRIAGILKAVGATSYKCFLTGKGNFRNETATILKYKGTRHSPKPYHYQTIWDYLIAKYDATVIEGYEADDAISMAQYQADGDTVICSRDKDLRMVRGYHYSWKCGERQPEKPLYSISEFEGSYNWAYQMLVGDTVDNIWGVPGIGPKKAKGILEACATYAELKAAVMATYLKVFGDEPINYQSWDGKWLTITYKGIAKENHHLLWMMKDIKEIPA